MIHFPVLVCVDVIALIWTGLAGFFGCMEISIESPLTVEVHHVKKALGEFTVQGPSSID